MFFFLRTKIVASKECYYSFTYSHYITVIFPFHGGKQSEIIPHIGQCYNRRAVGWECSPITGASYPGLDHAH